MNMTIDLNTLLVLSGLAINLYFVIDRSVLLEKRLSRLESWKRFVEEYLLPARRPDP